MYGKGLPLPCLPPPRLPLPFPLLLSHSQKHLCRKFRQICPTFSRVATTPHLFSSNGLPLTFASFQKNYVANSDRFSPHSLAWQPMKRRGYPLLATCQPVPDLWWNRFVEVIKIARIPPVVYTKSHHSSCDMLSLLTYRSYRSVSHHL